MSEVFACDRYRIRFEAVAFVKVFVPGGPHPDYPDWSHDTYPGAQPFMVYADIGAMPHIRQSVCFTGDEAHRFLSEYDAWVGGRK